MCNCTSEYDTVGNARQAPVAQPVQVNVGLDPTLQQMLLRMMQTQQNMLQLLAQKQEEESTNRTKRPMLRLPTSFMDIPWVRLQAVWAALLALVVLAV